MIPQSAQYLVVWVGIIVNLAALIIQIEHRDYIKENVCVSIVSLVVLIFVLFFI